MTNRQKRFAPQETINIFMRVNIGYICHVVALVFKPTEHTELPGCRAALSLKRRRVYRKSKSKTCCREIMCQEISCSDTVQRIGLNPPTVGAVERDTTSGVITIEGLANISTARGIVSGPWIVSLISRDRLLKHYIRGSRVAYGKDDVAFLAGGITMQLRQVDAAQPS